MASPVCSRNDSGVILLAHARILLARVVRSSTSRNIPLTLAYSVSSSWFRLYFSISWCSRSVVSFTRIGSAVKLMSSYWRYKDNMLTGFKMSHRSTVPARRLLFVALTLIPYTSGSFLSSYIASRVSRIQLYLKKWKIHDN